METNLRLIKPKTKIIPETLSSEFINNILLDFRDLISRGAEEKATGIMSDLILLRSSFEEQEKITKTKRR